MSGAMRKFSISPATLFAMPRRETAASVIHSTLPSKLGEMRKVEELMLPPSLALPSSNSLRRQNRCMTWR